MKGLLLLTLIHAIHAQNFFGLDVQPDGSFQVSVNGWSDFALQSHEIGVRINGVWFTTANKSLVLQGPLTSFAGSDALGSFNATAASWARSDTGAAVIYTIWKAYNGVSAIVFEQFIPNDIATGGNYYDRDSVSTAFPSFQGPQSATPIGLIQYSGPFINNGVLGPVFGRWAPGLLLENGVQSGPIVFFDQAAQHAVVFSSFSNFMIGNTAQDASGNLAAGLMGSLTTIPALTAYRSILYYGPGPNTAMMFWGEALLQTYGKSRQGSNFDYTNNYLGYNTDHGAYYYYTTGTYANYLDALLAVNDYAQQQGIPYKHILLDSWWYFKGIGDGVYNWTAMPSIFPGGNDGIRNLTSTTGWKVIAHNRYWSANTNYAKANGGPWNFAVDAQYSPAGGQMAVPLDQQFWEYLLTDSAKEWGLTTYEQDWLYNELNGVDVLNSNATLGRQWLLQMDAGAQAAGVTIQMCMPYPKHVLQSVEMQKATQVRVSDDHVPGLFSIDLTLQWRIGFSSLFAWAVALAPFKDNYYSKIGQPGGSVGNANETSPALQSAISILSAGPVTPGDGVGLSDPVMILRVCNQGGLLLKPSRAATAIDRQFAQRVFPGSGPSGEVYATYSAISGQIWDHVFAAVLNSSFTVVPADLNAIRADAALILPAGTAVPTITGTSTLAYSVNSTTFNVSTLRVQKFSSTSGIDLVACQEKDFQLWHTAPVFSNNIAYLGELGKFVPVSPQRTKSVDVLGTDVNVQLFGEAFEPVDVYFWFAGEVVHVACMLDASGSAQASMPSATC